MPRPWFITAASAEALAPEPEKRPGGLQGVEARHPRQEKTGHRARAQRPKGQQVLAGGAPVEGREEARCAGQAQAVEEDRQAELRQGPGRRSRGSITPKAMPAKSSAESPRLAPATLRRPKG